MRDPVTIALRCQDAGARVPSRCTRARARRCTPGSARWEEIAAVVGGARHPGDRQRRHQDGRGRRPHARARPNCAGIMIARGSFGQPWIFDQARDLLDGTPDAPGAGGRGALRRSRSITRAWCRPTRPIRAARPSSSASTSAGTSKGLPRRRRAAQEALRRDVVRRGRGDLRRLPRERASGTAASAAPTATPTTASRPTRHEARARPRPARARSRTARWPWSARSSRWRSSPPSRSASRRSITIARCARASPKSSTAAARPPSRSSRSPSRIAERGDGVLVDARAEPTPCSR